MGRRGGGLCPGLFEAEEAEGVNPFAGEACYRDNPLLATNPEVVDTNLVGNIPVWTGITQQLPFASYSGTQVIQFTEPTDNDPYMRDVKYVDQLPIILSASTGRLADGRSPVPVEVVRFGVYLHSLQDRISHWQCGDASYFTGPTPTDGKFVFFYSIEECGQDIHAVRHYNEMANTPLPTRTYSALNYTWDELEAFADIMRTNNPSWFVPRKKVSQVKLIGSTSRPGAIPLIFQIHTPEARVAAMVALIDELGYRQLPGHDPSMQCTIILEPDDTPTPPPTQTEPPD